MEFIDVEKSYCLKKIQVGLESYKDLYKETEMWSKMAQCPEILHCHSED